MKSLRRLRIIRDTERPMIGKVVCQMIKSMTMRSQVMKAMSQIMSYQKLRILI